MTNITQELNNARTFCLRAIECLTNVEGAFGVNYGATGKLAGTNTPGVVTMPGRRSTITPAGRRKIAKAQKARWAAKNGVATGTNRLAVNG